MIPKGKKLLLTLSFFISCGCFHSCIKQEIEKLRYPDKDSFFWNLEYEVNGEQYVWSEYEDNWYWYKQRFNWEYYPKYTGLKSYPEEERNLYKRQWSVDYSDLSFNVMLPSIGQDFYFHILGPGDGPFKDGKRYASPEDIVFCFPNLRRYSNYTWNTGVGPWRFDSDVDSDDAIICSFKDLDVKIISSSFRFKHTIKERVGEVLDFYFDFVEVITSAPPEENEQMPIVGDTLRITNGHFVQAPLGNGFIEKIVFD